MKTNLVLFSLKAVVFETFNMLFPYICTQIGLYSLHDLFPLFGQLRLDEANEEDNEEDIPTQVKSVVTGTQAIDIFS